MGSGNTEMPTGNAEETVVREPAGTDEGADVCADEVADDDPQSEEAGYGYGV